MILFNLWLNLFVYLLNLHFQHGFSYRDNFNDKITVSVSLHKSWRFPGFILFFCIFATSSLLSVSLSSLWRTIFQAPFLHILLFLLPFNFARPFPSSCTWNSRNIIFVFDRTLKKCRVCWEVYRQQPGPGSIFALRVCHEIWGGSEACKYSKREGKTPWLTWDGHGEILSLFQEDFTVEWTEIGKE